MVTGHRLLRRVADPKFNQPAAFSRDLPNPAPIICQSQGLESSQRFGFMTSPANMTTPQGESEARPAAQPITKLLVSGGRGLIGSAVLDVLNQRDTSLDVLHLTRSAKGENDVTWQPAEKDARIDADQLAGVDAVIHLAGEPVFGRWTKQKKQAIWNSRVMGTAALCRALAGMEHRPAVLACASAVGVYGSRGDQTLDESATAGSGFLADLAQAWEQATQPAIDAGIRVVHLRFGVVMSTQSGALAQMLPIFKAGLGGPLGDGSNWVPWIGHGDCARAVVHCMDHTDIDGPVNIVAPNPVTNRELTKTLGKAVGRPTVMPVPKFALRLRFGELADEALLASQRVVPSRLLEHSYQFAQPHLAGALQHELGNGAQPEVGDV